MVIQETSQWWWAKSSSSNCGSEICFLRTLFPQENTLVQAARPTSHRPSLPILFMYQSFFLPKTPGLNTNLTMAAASLETASNSLVILTSQSDTFIFPHFQALGHWGLLSLSILLYLETFMVRKNRFCSEGHTKVCPWAGPLKASVSSYLSVTPNHT